METTTYLSRDEAITRIKKALERRTGKRWSVTGGRGTAWGWITIDAAPARRTWRHRLKEGAPDRPENYEEYDSGQPGGGMGPEDRELLAKTMGLDQVHFQGESIPASSDYYRQAVERAETGSSTTQASPYWD